MDKDTIENPPSIKIEQPSTIENGVEKLEPIIIDSQLPPEIQRIENDFCESMLKFGVSLQYVEKYK